MSYHLFFMAPLPADRLSSTVRLGNELQKVAVRVGEVDTPAAIVAIDLAGGGASDQPNAPQI